MSFGAENWEAWGAIMAFVSLIFAGSLVYIRRNLWQRREHLEHVQAIKDKTCELRAERERLRNEVERIKRDPDPLKALAEAIRGTRKQKGNEHGA